MAESFSGLAKTVRENGTDQHDLSGYSQIQVSNLMSDAFKTKVRSADPIKVSFVVGAGRGQGRGKYPEVLPKWVSASLRAIGYSEDKHADTCWECQGVFKFAHDTDKNLKMMHVFPNIDKIEETAVTMQNDGSKRLNLAAVCSMEKFQALVNDKVWSFTSKNNLLEGLKAKRKILVAVEEKYVNLQEVTPAEEELYSAVTRDLVESKMTLLETQMEQLVADRQLTKQEQVIVVEKLEKRLKKLRKKLGKEESEKKKAKLETSISEMESRVSFVKSSPPAIWGRKNERDIRELEKALKELDLIEQRQIRSAADLKKLKKKEGYRTKLNALLEAESGWFESPVV